jgi:hypothetical protein
MGTAFEFRCPPPAGRHFSSSCIGTVKLLWGTPQKRD